jgi:hypothetical protein
MILNYCSLNCLFVIFTTYVFVNIAGEAFRTSPEKFDEKTKNQFGGVVLGAHQQQRFFKLLNVKLQQIEGLSENDYFYNFLIYMCLELLTN